MHNWERQARLRGADRGSAVACGQRAWHGLYVDRSNAVCPRWHDTNIQLLAHTIALELLATKCNQSLVLHGTFGRAHVRQPYVVKAQARCCVRQGADAQRLDHHYRHCRCKYGCCNCTCSAAVRTCSPVSSVRYGRRRETHRNAQHAQLMSCAAPAQGMPTRGWEEKQRGGSAAGTGDVPAEFWSNCRRLAAPRGRCCPL